MTLAHLWLFVVLQLKSRNEKVQLVLCWAHLQTPVGVILVQNYNMFCLLSQAMIFPSDNLIIACNLWSTMPQSPLGSRGH